jgi:hypothetical protein
MSDLDKALNDISNIRMQMARNTEFRGYGPATLATTSLIAIAAAVVQIRVFPDPADHLGGYLGIWVSTAVLSAVLTAVQVSRRSRRIHSGMSDEMIRMAVEQFLPAVAAGLLLTIVLVLYVPGALWMLPGIWQIIFSLGVFSSCRFLPRPVLAVGAWYLIAGLACISLGGSRALSPWAMAIPFGAGQLLVSAILFFNTTESSDEV